MAEPQEAVEQRAPTGPELIHEFVAAGIELVKARDVLSKAKAAYNQAKAARPKAEGEIAAMMQDARDGQLSLAFHPGVAV